MKALLRHFWRVCTVSAGPQDTPYSPPLMGLLLLLYVVTGIPGLLPEFAFPSALAQALVDVAILVAVSGAALALRRRTNRLVQTLSTLFGVGVLFNLMALPVLLGTYASQEIGGLAGLSLLLVALFIWYLIIAGHIFHQGLALPFPAGVLVAFVYVFAAMTIVGRLFPSEVLQ